jgi:DNA repair photolyase
LDLSEVVIRRRGFLDVLKRQLLNDDGSRIYNDPNDHRVLYSSTLVDVAATPEILEETAAGCIQIFDHTEWDIRLLSKSHRLADLVLKKMIPEKYHHRLILGFSTGTLDDDLAAAIEVGTSLVSLRIEALHKLQDRGIRTFGMVCPSLVYGTQEEYDEFSRLMCEKLRVDKLEHLWAEVINVRGESLKRTIAALDGAGFKTAARRLEAVSGPGSNPKREAYARSTFDAHAKHVPADKLRFLQYVTPKSACCWKAEQKNGAVLLGTYAEANNLITINTSAPSEPLPDLDDEDIRYRHEREEVVTTALNNSLAAAEALYQIKTYKDGLLWRKDFRSFEKYCLARWGCGKSEAYRRLQYGGLVARLKNGESPIGENNLPQNESQIRTMLVKVPEEHQVEFWHDLKDKIPADKRTATTINAEIPKFLKKKGLVTKPSARPKPDYKKLAKLQLEKIKAMIGKLPVPERFTQLLLGFEILIDQDPQGSDEGPETAAESAEAGVSATTPEPVPGGRDAPGGLRDAPDGFPGDYQTAMRDGGPKAADAHGGGADDRHPINRDRVAEAMAAVGPHDKAATAPAATASASSSGGTRQAAGGKKPVKPARAKTSPAENPDSTLTGRTTTN